eukprot:scaffold31629_cov117-Isochrysis_galbana.AAC.3
MLPPIEGRRLRTETRAASASALAASSCAARAIACRSYAWHRAMSSTFCCSNMLRRVTSAPRDIVQLVDDELPEYSKPPSSSGDLLSSPKPKVSLPQLCSRSSRSRPTPTASSAPTTAASSSSSTIRPRADRPGRRRGGRPAPSGEQAVYF